MSHRLRPPPPGEFADSSLVREARESNTKKEREWAAKLTTLGRCPRCTLLLPCDPCLPASAADLPLRRNVD